jgi:ABC-type Na+ transport system ATPase subunit NatA
MVCSKVVIINKGRVVVESDMTSLAKDKSLEQVFIDSVSKDYSAEVPASA